VSVLICFCYCILFCNNDDDNDDADENAKRFFENLVKAHNYKFVFSVK